MVTLNLKATQVAALERLIKQALIDNEQKLTQTYYEDEEYTRLMELECDYVEILEQLPVGKKWWL